MKSFVVAAPVLLILGAALTGPVVAQQQSPLQSQLQQAPQIKACVSQYVDAPGRTPAGLIAAGFDIKAALAAGLWLQKDREVFYCNSSGRLEEKQALCWQLREPGPGGLC